MLDQLQIFYGELNPFRARLYVRAPRPEVGDWVLRGEVEGPVRAEGYMLAATFALRDLGPGDTLLAGAQVVDPCTWSMKMPAKYHVSVTAENSAGESHTAEYQIGFRSLGAKGRSFYWEKERWVPRAVTLSAEQLSNMDLADQQGNVLVVDRPTEAVCREASDHGVALAVIVQADSPDFATEVQRLARHPAVCFAMIQGDISAVENASDLGPNLIWLPWVDPRRPTPLPSWANGVVVDATDQKAFAGYVATCDTLVVAYRQANEDQRQQCDVLQKDLVEIGDFAGYWC